MKYLLDTNAFVDHLRNGTASKVTQRLLVMPANSVFLCSIVLAELIFGAVRSGPIHEASNRAMIDGLKQVFTELPFDDFAADHYGVLRSRLQKLGTPMGANDLFIASIAIAHGATLVTHNLAEFSRISGLSIEDWQS